MVEDSIDDYQIILRRRSRRNPSEWLKPYQERFAAATRQAAAETTHLSGEERKIASRLIVKGILDAYKKDPEHGRPGAERVRPDRPKHLDARGHLATDEEVVEVEVAGIEPASNSGP